MELCEGSVKDYVEGKLEGIPKISLDEKILVGQVALGLAYIHDKGIIHKDLKLENILLKRHSNLLVLAKIADFGLAKELKPGRSEFSETEHPGTESYMAPELLSAPGDIYPASFASDVYALGITIARIVLKGKHPFSSNEIWRKVSMVKGLVPQNLEGLSWDLIDLILKLTDKDPGKRPNMFLVLLHPYFVLTNDSTKRHFVDQFWTSFQELITEENKKKQMKKIFNNRNFREWYDTLSRDKQDSDEEIEEMTKTLKSFSNFVSIYRPMNRTYFSVGYRKHPLQSNVPYTCVSNSKGLISHIT
jgi:serine/threonine protein kinase